MKRLLIPLLAALALPTAVNAESYWLIMQTVVGVDKLEMESLEQCQEQGLLWKTSKQFYWVTSKQQRFICLKGK